MKKTFPLLFLLLFISCVQKDWKTILQDEIDTYDKNLRIAKSYRLNHPHGFLIDIVKYETAPNGMQKLTATYVSPKPFKLEKTFFYTTRGNLLYRSVNSISERTSQSEEKPDAIVVVEITKWFKNDSEGIEEVKEIPVLHFNELESYLKQMPSLNPRVQALSSEDYNSSLQDLQLLSQSKWSKSKTSIK